MTSPSQHRDAHMLFLAGHGLQTPLSAIRWGCSRLGKLARAKLTTQERKLLDGIQTQAKALSGMVQALLLVAKVEDGMYKPREQEIFLRDFLVSFTPLRELAGGKTPRITCPKDLLLRADRGVLEAVVHAVAVILQPAVSAGHPLRLLATAIGGECRITCSPAIEFSFLREETDLDDDSPHLVGGVPGLMLSIASSLSAFLGGSIEAEKHEKNTHKLLLRLPLHSAVAAPKREPSLVL